MAVTEEISSDELELEDNSQSDDGLELEDNQMDGDGDASLQLEENDDAELQLEENDDAELQLEENGGADDDDGSLLLEENEAGDDGLQLEGNDDDGLQIEENDGGSGGSGSDGENLLLEANHNDGDPTPTVLRIGAPVTLAGLRARPELNGRSGRVVSTPKTPEGRTGVQVEGVIAPLSLKAESIVEKVPPPRIVCGDPWRATEADKHAASAALAAMLDDALLDSYELPEHMALSVLGKSEVAQCESAALGWVEKTTRAHADPNGMMVAKEMGLLDPEDCRLSNAAVKVRNHFRCSI